MITKFERKVIAGVTAGMMCLSMMFAAPFSVNAGEEQTQNEAASSAHQEYKTEDVQRQDEKAEDAWEDKATESETTEDTDRQDGESLEISSERMDSVFAAAFAEDVEGNIILTKDGTEESGMAVLEVEEYSVSYRLEVEEDGQYYFEASADDTDHWSQVDIDISKETVNGEERVEISNSRANLLKDEVYYLTITEYSTEIQRSVTWKAGKVKDIKPGEFHVELNAENSAAYYRLTVAETEIYFCSSDINVRVEIIDPETGYPFSVSSNYVLKGDTVYEITVKRYSEDDISGKWRILQGTEKEEVESDKAYISESDDYFYYKFVPEKTGYYSSEGRFYDSGWNQIYSKEMIAGETYYLVPSYGRYWSIWEYDYNPGGSGPEYETIDVNVGETYTHDVNDKDKTYVFRPKETASYRIRTSGKVKMEIRDRYGLDGNITLEGQIDSSMVMMVDNVYEMRLYEQDAETISWVIEKAELKMAEEGKRYTVKESGAEVYDFVPGKSGEYVVSFNQKGKLSVYDDEWKKIGGFACNESDGRGIVVAMEQGKSYHLAIVALEAEVQWNIEQAKTTNGYIYRELSDNNVEILQYAGTENNITIPNKIGDKVVKRIGADSFANNEIIVGVTIPAQVTDLQYGAFKYCSNLKEVTFAQGSQLKKIGVEVFQSCNELEEIHIPDSVESIGDKAFSYCSKLENVTIGNKLANISKSAFSGCGLSEITWGESVTKIGYRAFHSNRKLTTVSIPNTVTEIEYGAFGSCVGLHDVRIPDSVEAIGGHVFDANEDDLIEKNTAWYDAQSDGDIYAGKVYYKYKGKIAENGAVKLKDGTKGIAGYAFLDQRNLTEIEIPDSVTNIGEYAFVGCEKLHKVTIPVSVTKIGKNALGYLTSGIISEAYKLEGFTIRGVAGSAAETYAKENGFIFEAYEPTYEKGDVNFDGKVDVADVRMTLRSVCQKVTLTEQQKLAADVEKDNVVDIKDLRKILRFVCDKIEEL